MFTIFLFCFLFLFLICFWYDAARFRFVLVWWINGLVLRTIVQINENWDKLISRIQNFNNHSHATSTHARMHSDGFDNDFISIYLIWINCIYVCFGCCAGGGGCALKHCIRNAVYVMNATPIANKAYIKMFNSGWRKRFFLSHSRTSFSDLRSPRNMLGKRRRKYTIEGRWVTPHLRAYRASAILTKVMSKLSVSLSMFSSFSRICLLSSECTSSKTQ